MKNDVVLVSVRGKDAPGITSSLTSVLAKDRKAKLLDIEQSVVHKKLILSILVQFPSRNHDRSPLLKDLLFKAHRLGCEITFEVFDPTLLGEEVVKNQYVISCLGSEVGADFIATLSKMLASKKVNIDKISRLSLKNLKALEIVAHAVKPIDPKRLTKELLQLSSKAGIDLAIQEKGLLRQAKRIVVMDMDSTLIASEVIDEIARLTKSLKKVSKITQAAMNGEIDFSQSLKKRVRLLKGLSENSLEKVYKGLKLTKGALLLIKVLKSLGYKVALVSGGFTYFTEKFRKRLGLDYAFANQLEIRNGFLTGRVIGPIVDAKRKAMILEMIAQGEGIPKEQIIAIGDGANDIPMLLKAGLGVAFNAKPTVREKANYSLSNHNSLDSILYLLGISEEEIKRLGK